MSYFFTSESVTPGHPDKICDRISDSILDAALANDKQSKVAIEALCSKGFVQITGQMSTDKYIDVSKVVRESIKKSGYYNSEFGFDANTCGVNIAIDEQSDDISNNIFKKPNSKKNNYSITDKNVGAGDQGIIFGYACLESKNYMPLPITIAHQLAKKHNEVFFENTSFDCSKSINTFSNLSSNSTSNTSLNSRSNTSLNSRSNTSKLLGPDAKTQITVKYSDTGKIERVEKILLVTQHTSNFPLVEVRKFVLEKIIKPVFQENNYLLPSLNNILINPSGPFIIGGPVADTGLTGRKIIVDTYGGSAPHGGGAFSGKDPSKVDRSAAYALRQIAKSIVANGLAGICKIQISYALGLSNPMSIFVDTNGTGDDRKIEKIINDKFDLRPNATIDNLGLRKPIYTETSNFGHFTNQSFPWEKIIEL